MGGYQIQPPVEEPIPRFSQLVVYLARYAYMRLQTEILSLHVTVVDEEEVVSPRLTSQGNNSIAWMRRLPTGPVATVGELVERLRPFPADMPVGLADTGFDVHSGIFGLSVEPDHEAAGKLLLVGDFQDGIEEWIDEDE